MSDERKRGQPQQPPTPKPAQPDDEVQEASEESFPASDPPSWSPLHSGSPKDEPQDHRDER